MIVVIQCAARKVPTAGHLTLSDGTPVMFVADPELAPSTPGLRFARPDDNSESSLTWREELLRYNRKGSDNPLGLLPAWQLYTHPTYERLAAKVGLERLYILSAGWGLISAKFLTPHYDITFSPRADKYKRRRRRDRYHDLCMLPEGTTDPIVFYGGKDYLPLFCTLTESYRGRRSIFYNSSRVPDSPGCTLRRFETTTRTNWHYECANAFVQGKPQVDAPPD